MTEKKQTVLWLHYLSELENGKEMYDEELLKELMAVPEIAQALELSKESAYTKAELEAYDRYWDAVRVERSLLSDSHEAGLKEGIELGMEKGMEKVKIEGKIEVILNGYANGLSVEMLSKITQLSENEVEEILIEDSGR